MYNEQFSGIKIIDDKVRLQQTVADILLYLQAWYLHPKNIACDLRYKIALSNLT